MAKYKIKLRDTGTVDMAVLVDARSSDEALDKVAVGDFDTVLSTSPLEITSSRVLEVVEA